MKKIIVIMLFTASPGTVPCAWIVIRPNVGHPLCVGAAAW